MGLLIIIATSSICLDCFVLPGPNKAFTLSTVRNRTCALVNEFLQTLNEETTAKDGGCAIFRKR